MIGYMQVQVSAVPPVVLCWLNSVAMARGKLVFDN